MRIAVAGKGGSGKTTIAGTLARALAQQGREVLALDADTNPNLAVTLGLPASESNELPGLPRDLMARQTQADGSTKVVFIADPEQVLKDYGALAPDRVRLIVMGKVNHGGAG
ncbi:MAG: AAA family ATPase [Gemmatimonadales bacterium]